MQNVDPEANKSCTIDEFNLDSAKVPPATSSSTPPTGRPADITSPEGVQSDSQTRRKSKTRSRFSSALRKLSKSKKKKEEVSTTVLLNEPNETSILSSGGEETGEGSAGIPPVDKIKPKKTKLAKRFLLSSLRKSKSNTKKESLEESENSAAVLEREIHKEGQTTEINIKESEGTNDKEGKKRSDSEDTLTNSPQQIDLVGKVNITISSKRAEQTEESEKQSPIGTPKTESPTETDYLTPIGDIAVTTATAQSRIDTATIQEPSTSPSSVEPSEPCKTKKKKLKTTPSAPDSVTQNQTKAPTAQKQKIKPKTSTSTPTEERFVITRSVRDTPPRERAPTKPNRVVVASTVATAFSKSRTGASGTGALRKPTTQTTATVGSQRASTVSSAVVTKRQRTAPPTAITSSRERQTELMQTPQSTLQRGHRFPKPTATTVSNVGHITPSTTTPSTSGSKSETAHTCEAVSTVEEHQPSNQEQIQLQSHASLASQPTTNPQPQSLQSNANLQPPSSTLTLVPRSPIGNSETRSPTNRSTSSNKYDIKPSVAELEDHLYVADESVVTASSSGPDEIVSSAESAQPSEYSFTNIPDVEEIGCVSKSDNFREVPREIATVRFSVGSAVRPQLTSFELYDQSSFDSNRSSDSQSPTSESSRRRIRYIAQPTLHDEYENEIRRRRESLQYQVGLSERTVDSEYDSGENQMPAFGDLSMEQDAEPTIMTSANTEKREHLYKILVIGELGTGKTSFIKRYVHQFFSQNYRATIGVDFALKVLNWDPNTIVRLQLWDIAGQERFGNMTRVYYKEAVGAFIVFDVTRNGTFECVSKWKEDLDSKVQLPDGSPIPCILLANKCDQEKQGIVTSPDKMDEYVRENGFAGWFETSAKENINIDEAARALVNKILLNDKLITAADLADSEKFNLNNSSDQTATDAKSKCSC